VRDVSNVDGDEADEEGDEDASCWKHHLVRGRQAVGKQQEQRH